MADKILAYPGEDYFVAFLSTRGIRLTAENPEVIHYFGTSKRKIKSMVADHDPDLVVIHNPRAFDESYKFPFVLDHIENDKDIYTPREITTNCASLARLHYQSLGLERVVNDITERLKKKKKEKLKINSNAVKKVFSAMMWD